MSTPLWATVANLLDSVSPTGEAAEALRIERVRVDLPVDLTFRRTRDGVEVMGAPPRWRLRTAFDRPPGRMRIDIRREPPAEELPGFEDEGPGAPPSADPYDLELTPVAADGRDPFAGRDEPADRADAEVAA